MATVSALRQDYLNDYLGRADGSTLPWSDTQCDNAITTALYQLWPDVGVFTTGDATTSSTDQLVTVPAALGSEMGEYRISRIDVIDSSGTYVDKVTNWRPHSATQIVMKPKLTSGLTLRFYGWTRYLVDGSNLPVRLEAVVAMKAAALAYGNLEGQLANSQNMQGLDMGRTVDAQTAAGLSAYWERRYNERIRFDPSYITLAPRSAYR
jgi:hypothetical protein